MPGEIQNFFDEVMELAPLLKPLRMNCGPHSSQRIPAPQFLFNCPPEVQGARVARAKARAVVAENKRAAKEAENS